MKKCIYFPFVISSSDICIGPSRFARWEQKEQPSQTDQSSLHGVDGVVPVVLDIQTVVAPNDLIREQRQPLSMLPPLWGDQSDDEGTTKKPCPPSGCSNDKNLNKDIYADLFKEETKKVEKWNPKNRDQWREVHMRVVDIMRPRVRENRKYLQQDKEGPAIAEGPEFIMKDGGIFYPAFKKSLQQMYADQRRLRPDQYDPQEHATMTAMEKAFHNGATQVSHVSHNKDASGKEAIRDEIVMVWDAETNRGRQIIQNITQGGKFLSVEEAREVMQKRSPEVTEVDLGDGAFIFTDTGHVISEKHTHQSVPRDIMHDDISMNSQTENIDISEPIRRRLVDNIRDSVAVDAPLSSRDRFENVAIQFDAIVSLGDVPADQQAHRKGNTVIPPFLRRLLGIPLEKQEEEQKYNTDKKIAGADEERRQSNSEQLKELLHHVDHRIREAGKQFIARVVGRWQEMMAVKSLFAFAAESGVGIGVALLGMKFMTRELPKVPNVQHLEPALHKRSAPDTAVEREKVKKLKRVRAIHRFQSGVDKITLKRYFVKKKIQGLGLVQPVTEGYKQKFLKKDRVRVSAPEIKGRVVKPIERLWKALRVLTRRLERLKKRSFRTVPQEEKGISQKQKKERVWAQRAVEVRHEETVLQFSFAWTLWVFLFFPCARDAKHFLSEGRTSRFKKGSKNSPMRLVTTELLSEGEPRPWILLGIIWYLSMIRESGFGNKPTSQYANIANTTNPSLNGTNRQSYLLPRGVIFAFTS